ncbi:ABC-type bacteriocin/lantibiotic exporter with double-glycine peptidase domain [Knoellia remsis]|uniref:ABC-type bacteriocin/lantibiotic exporter with double-glycine peptidase domain n=1 Tax=Knoellia remsis TaxID=407159 RepID=A0A2T0UZD4_9MICO|nr:ABC transporter ATP-binding protein [Knoellia remsis]PRY63198.1 ABC-type bacteriocin/lantibiotic exporter with double-glycine peptidase domain [Knoellia remsis]
MISLTGPVPRRVARVLGFPEGTGELVSPATRRKLVISIGLSVVLSLLDTLGVLAMVPMMQYVTGQDHDSGALGYINRFLGEPGDRQLVLAVSLLIVGAFVVKDVAALLVRRWQLRFMAAEQISTATRLLEGYLRGPFAWHLRTNTGDKLWTVQGATAAGYSGGLSSALSAITEVFTISFIFISLLFISPVAALAALAYLGLAGFVVQRLIRPRIVAAGERNLKASQAVSKSSLQSLTSVKEIKLRQAHGRFVEEFRAANVVGAEANVTASVLSEIPKYFLEIVFVVGVGLLAVGVTSNATSGEGILLLGVFVAAGTRILPSAVRLIAAIAGIRFAQGPLAHVVHVNRMQQDAQREEHAALRTSETPTGDIAVRDVTFAYGDQPDELVLRGVSLDIPKASSVAIVGSSGAGKSTLVDLLLGLHQPLSGDVTAGGVSIFDNLPAWQRRLAVVPQDVTLLDESLRDNIAFDEEVDEARMDEAVDRAQLRDLISHLPDGLDTTIGERGVRLSGGQRQRIGIARALYRRPEVLVLDEATSALDNETENRLTETIRGLSGSMTMVIVAHRLSTVRHVDQLVFMSKGKVATTGTFAEVARENAEFAHLVALGQLLETQGEHAQR